MQPALPPVEVPPEPVIFVTARALDDAKGREIYDLVTIPRERLALSPSNRLEDVLRDIPGFQQFRRSDARSANPTSQGATLRGLGGNASSRVLVLLDGVPQTDPFGGWIAWPALDPRRLGEVRVMRGGGSGADGPGALAGTIELDSVAGASRLSTTIGTALGSRGGVDAHGLLAAPLADGSISLFGAYARGDGFVPIVAEQRGPVDRPSPYRQGQFALRGVAPLGGRVEMQASLSAFADRRERGTPFSEIDSRGADASLQLVGRGALPFAALLYVQDRQFSNAFAAVNAARTTASQTLDQYTVPSIGLGARAEVRPRLGGGEVRLGVDWRETRGETRELFQFVNGAPTRGRAAGGRMRTIGGFAELGWTLGAVTLSGGGRIDRWSIGDGRLDEGLLVSGVPLNRVDFADRAGWEASGRGGIGWQAAQSLYLRGAIYRGWRMPTLNELYRPFRLGTDATAANAGLDPERLTGAEAGLEWQPIPSLSLVATAFTARLNNAIANVTLAQGPGTFPGVGFVGAGGQYRQRQNLESIRSRGVELESQLAIGSVILVAGYSLVDAGVRGAGISAALNGMRPAQVPRQIASLTATWRDRHGAMAVLSANYVGEQFEDDLNRHSLGDALTFGTAVLAPLGRGFFIEARAENLTGARVMAAVSAAGIVERATPRTLWIGLRFSP